MRVLSVDLASRDPKDLGLVVLQSNRSGLPTAQRIDPLTLLLRKPLVAHEVAQALFYLSASWDCNSIAIDGPQAWKDPTNGLMHSRVCDRGFNAPAKVGLPGEVKPRTYTGFVDYSIRVFDHLAALGLPRLSSREEDGIGRAMEAFPLGSWRSLGLLPLAAKAKCKPEILERRWHEVKPLVDVPFRPTHDELQAVLGGLGTLRLLEGRRREVVIRGEGPFLLEGIWREGFIVCAGRERIPA